MQMFQNIVVWLITYKENKEKLLKADVEISRFKHPNRSIYFVIFFFWQKETIIDVNSQEWKFVSSLKKTKNKNKSVSPNGNQTVIQISWVQSSAFHFTRSE